MKPEVEQLFVATRRLHVVFLVGVGVIASLAIQREFATTGSPILEDRPSLLWALRLGLAVLSVVAVATVEWLVQQGRNPNPSGTFRGVPAPSQKLRTDAMLRMMFYEAIAVYGLLLVLLGGSWRDMMCFASVAVALLVWKFPRRSAWEDATTQISPPPASGAGGP
jgi:hypothetical protein